MSPRSILVVVLVYTLSLVVSAAPLPDGEMFSLRTTMSSRPEMRETAVRDIAAGRSSFDEVTRVQGISRYVESCMCWTD